MQNKFKKQLNFGDYHSRDRMELKPLLPKDVKRVLEIGCGEGNFSINLNEGIEYWGVEPVLEASKIASKRLFRVIHGTWNDAKIHLPDNYFDLIVCNDVIEHMEDHELFLEEIKNKMCMDNSYIIGSIPNVRYIKNLIKLLIQKDWKYEESGILDKTHLRFFTEISLKRVFKKKSYRIIHFTYLNDIYDTTIIEYGFLRKLIINFLVSIVGIMLGRDVRYLQFGFLIQKI